MGPTPLNPPSAMTSTIRCSRASLLMMPEQSKQKHDRQRYAQKTKQCATSNAHKIPPSSNDWMTQDAGAKVCFGGTGAAD